MKQTIIIDNTEYLLTPIQEGVINSFTEFLDGLDPDIYNRSLDEFGKSHNLKEFSNLLESDNLDITDTNKLKEYIFWFKNTVEYVIKNRISELYNYYGVEDGTFIKNLDYVINVVKRTVEEAERLKFTDKQEYLNFEDQLNFYSIKEHV